MKRLMHEKKEESFHGSFDFRIPFLAAIISLVLVLIIIAGAVFIIWAPELGVTWNYSRLALIGLDVIVLHAAIALGYLILGRRTQSKILCWSAAVLYLNAVTYFLLVTLGIGDISNSVHVLLIFTDGALSIVLGLSLLRCINFLGWQKTTLSITLIIFGAVETSLFFSGIAGFLIPIVTVSEALFFYKLAIFRR